MKPVVVRVGRITVALGLIAFGITLLLENTIGSSGFSSWVYKLWPLLLVGFGAEYLIRSVLAGQTREGEPPLALRFDLGGAFLLILVVLLTTGITTVRSWVASGTNGRFPVFSFGSGSVERTETRTFELGGARELRVDVPAGTIRLEQGSGPSVNVNATYVAHGVVLDGQAVMRELEQIRLEAGQGGSLSLRAVIPPGLHNVSVNLTLRVPPDLKVTAETGAGRIQVPNYKGELDLRSGAGQIQVDSGAGSLSISTGASQIVVNQFDGPVSAKAGVGSITLRNILGPIQADTGTGAISIRDFQGGKLVAETRTGGLHVTTGAVLEGDVILKTSAGSVTLEVPKESSMRVTAQTRAGSLNLPEFMATSGSAPARSGMGTNGEGKYTVTLEAGTGSVNFQTR